jgi:hypothetical protein
MSARPYCPACNAGPFKSQRGLQQHLTKSYQCALMEGQSFSVTLGPHIPCVASDTASDGRAVYPGEDFPGKECAGPQSKAQDVVDQLMKMFRAVSNVERFVRTILEWIIFVRKALSNVGMRYERTKIERFASKIRTQ